MTLTRPSGFDPWPSSRTVAGCAWRLLTVSTVGLVAYVAILAVATTAGHLLAGPDPRLLRAACASKTSAMQARSMASVMTFRRPDAREVVAAVRRATETETRAWADVEEVCP